MSKYWFNSAVPGVFAESGSKYDGSSKCCPSAHRMDNCGPCEIDKAEVFKPSAAI